MVRLVIALSIVVVVFGDVGAPGAQPCSLDDATELLQTFPGPELMPAESKQLASRPTTHKRKDVTMISQMLKKQTSILVRQKTRELLGRIPGLPSTLNPIIGWYVYDFIMHTRQTSESNAYFIDYLFSKMANYTTDQLDAPTLWHLVHKAANRSHVAGGMKEFLGEVDGIFAQFTSGYPDPKALFHMLALGSGKLGVQKDITDFMENASVMFGDMFGPNKTTMVDTSKLFPLMSNLYRNMGLPEDLIHIVDEFGKVFTVDPSKIPDPTEILNMTGKIMKNLGMPDAIAEFCGDMGKLIKGDKEVTPHQIFTMMGKVLTSMGAPPELIQTIGNGIDHGLNGTAGPQEIMASLAKNMQVGFHPEALFGSFLQMHSDVRDLVQHDPAPTKERLASTIVPHMLFMVHEGASGL